MSVAKIAISLDRDLLKKLDALIDQEHLDSRSQIISQAIEAILQQRSRAAFERECEKLDPAEEQGMAEERYTSEVEWEKF